VVNLKKARRPKQIQQRPKLSADERGKLAARVKYVGSPEHKTKRWWGGLPESKQMKGGKVGRPGKQTTTICPLVGDQDRQMATEWIQCAIKEGKFEFYQGDQDFPKKVWYEADGQIWQGLIVNKAAGEYKGWPIVKEDQHEIFD